MGLRYNEYLNGDRILVCKRCKAHMADQNDLVSRTNKRDSSAASNLCQNFRGTHGRGHLFRTLVNVRAAQPETRDMSTGKHIVRDVFCMGCDAGVGWVYDKAWEESQRYKEGMYILEMELVTCARS
ncbi:uncharacterized protein PpBr36_10480 [Pyricularia pennisetigena]|uniref:uncharacterized protein n=1 Tax=Pyricularia pennisetigena TaxID=1578925 RepID=UPI001153F70C|nr:uncharacterized protein PpBr36_10480 [Pyricularia pennisetigena]TLS21272.1 hypothetical protein PpBr36_10480 [Pyricularia pennisetigena]